MDTSSIGRSGAQNILAFATFGVIAVSGVLGLGALYAATSLRVFAILVLGIGIFAFVVMIAAVVTITGLPSAGTLQVNVWTWALISLAVATNILLFRAFWIYLPLVVILGALALADLRIRANRRRSTSSSTVGLSARNP
ncbi:hypothetical protein [Rhodococcus qingshengii]|uniref:Uncharacterized protein n=1 Tax=Rhodococcus qingshengii TaxID=334542 RepID=A0A2A5J460_RHOSG|nr:hypothetical protein [Rhodococcus qingshengii]PCK24388.1 hypothetical protein CHR55_26220 [Rhodococcus qingshengii]